MSDRPVGGLVHDAKFPSETSKVPTSTRVIETRELFGDGKEVRIVHHGTEYRLQITRQGKLILTK